MNKQQKIEHKANNLFKGLSTYAKNKYFRKDILNYVELSNLFNNFNFTYYNDYILNYLYINDIVNNKLYVSETYDLSLDLEYSFKSMKSNFKDTKNVNIIFNILNQVFKDYDQFKTKSFYISKYFNYKETYMSIYKFLLLFLNKDYIGNYNKKLFDNKGYNIIGTNGYCEALSYDPKKYLALDRFTPLKSLSLKTDLDPKTFNDTINNIFYTQLYKYNKNNFFRIAKVNFYNLLQD